MLVALPLWLDLLFLLGPAALGAALGLQAARDSATPTIDDVLRRRPVLWGVFVSAVLPFPIAGLLLWNERLALRLPLLLQYWGPSMVMWLLVLSGGFLLALSLALAYAGRHRERHKLLLVAVLLGAALAYVQICYPRPIAPDLVHEVASDGSIVQSSNASCAPAAGANIARAFGVAALEPAVAGAMGTTAMFGTSLPQIVVGMRQFGIDCTTVISDTADPGVLSPPAFLFVDHPVVGREAHVIALMGRRGANFEVIDPLVGRVQWSTAKLQQTWHGLAANCRRVAL